MGVTTVRVDLGEGFCDEMAQRMDQALDEAQRKWGLSLNSGDKHLVLNHALEQVRMQMGDYLRSDWDGGSRMVVQVSGWHDGVLNLPDPRSREPRESLVRLKTGWVVDREDHEQAVEVADLLDHLQEKALKMADTAVFYGVGSFTEG